MNQLFQIAIGTAPVLIFLVLMAIFRKNGRVLNIVLSSVVGCAIAVSVICGFTVEPEQKKTVASETTAVERLEIVYAVAAEGGDRDYAAELLSSMRKDSMENEELILCSAYIRGAEGDWRSAKLLYQKAQALGCEKDSQMESLCEAVSKAGENMASALDAVKKHAAEKIEDMAEDASEEASAVADVLCQSQWIFEEFRETGDYSESSAENLAEKLNSAIKADPTLLELDEIRACRVRLLALSGEYDQIAGNLDEDAIYLELSVASDLYLNEYISDSSFSKQYVGDYKHKIRAVYDQLVIVRDNTENEADRKLVKALLETMKRRLDPSAMDILEDGITTVTKDTSDPNVPKAYMQLARIAFKNDDDAAARAHIASAMSTAGVSDDAAFYDPLSQIVRIVSEKENSAELKDLSGYVDQVVSNTSDELISGIIHTDSTQPSSFETFMDTTLEQMRVSINITDVNTDEFSKVVATVNINEDLSISAEELKQMLTVNDCGIEITDFTVEKVEYQAANIMLCCDVSGSMSGEPIEALKSAVKAFIESASDKENLALITFHSDIDSVSDFGTDRESLISKADSLYATGGTNMYGTLMEAMEMFSVEPGELNYILLLSDGDDNVSHSEQEIQTYIGSPAMEKGVVVYSLGVGYGVNTEYMEQLAKSTGGVFVYMDDTQTMETFYSDLRSQMLNQYTVTFEAKDTLTANRTLVISTADEEFCRDTAYYTLSGAVAEDVGSDPLISKDAKGVYGLDNSLIYKSSISTTVKLNGYGFAEDDVMTVTLDGDLNYSAVSCTYIDSNTFAIEIPGNMACGTYNVKINIGSLSGVIREGISIVEQGSEKITAVGPYVFTSYKKKVSGDETVLSQMVNLNGWLTFRGDVTLTKDPLDERRVILRDNSGAYVSYSTDTATGLAGIFAKNSWRLPIPALGEMVIINDELANPQSPDYPVEMKAIAGLHFSGTFTMETPGVALYPYKLEVKSDAFTTEFPMQSMILKAANVENLYNFDVAIGGSITNQSINIKAELSTLSGDDEYKQVNFGSAPIYVAPANFKVSIDTEKNEYVLDFAIKLGFIKNEGIGLYIKWSNRDTDEGLQWLMPSELLFKSDNKIKTTICQVPVTYRDFKLGAADMDLNKSIWDWKLKGSFDLGTGKVSDVVPGLEEFIDDPYLLLLNDTTIQFSWGQKYFSVESKLEFLEAIELGHVKIEAGNISVDSMLLGYDQENVTGLRAELGRGFKWEVTACTVDVGGTGILHLHDKFLGVEAEGHVKAKIGWWIFSVNFEEQAQAVIGVQYLDELPTFVIKFAGSNVNGGTGYYLMWNEQIDMQCGKMTL